MIFIFLFLTYFTLHHRLWGHPPQFNWLSFLPFYGWVVISKAPSQYESEPGCSETFFFWLTRREQRLSGACLDTAFGEIQAPCSGQSNSVAPWHPLTPTESPVQGPLACPCSLMRLRLSPGSCTRMLWPLPNVSSLIAGLWPPRTASLNASSLPPHPSAMPTPSCHCLTPWLGDLDYLLLRESWRRKWQPTPVPLPGEPHGQRSLVGCRPWGRRVRHEWGITTCLGRALSHPWNLGPFPFWRRSLPGWPPCLMDPRMPHGPSCHDHAGRSWLEGRLSIWPTGAMLPPRGPLSTLRVNLAHRP